MYVQDLLASYAGGFKACAVSTSPPACYWVRVNRKPANSLRWEYPGDYGARTSACVLVWRRLECEECELCKSGVFTTYVQGPCARGTFPARVIADGSLQIKTEHWRGKPSDSVTINTGIHGRRHVAASPTHLQPHPLSCTAQLSCAHVNLKYTVYIPMDGNA